MSDYPAVAESPSGEPHPRLRAAALTAVVAGLVLVAGAAFVLSYQGIHQIALNAGVSPELARLYPVILDAMLVMSCAAALALRTAGPWTRCYVWACLILLLAAVAAGNALYAMNISLPAQPTRAVVAVLPWALLLMGFGMLLVMLRHWRRIRAAGAEAVPADPAGPGEDVAAAATVGAVSRAASPDNGPAKASTLPSGIRVMEPRTGHPPEPAGVAAGAAGARAAIASGEAADGKRPSPATTPESAGAAGRDDAASRPPATPADEDPDVRPAVSYEPEPAAPARTTGAAGANGPGGGTQPTAPTGAAGPGPAPAPPPGPGAPGTTGAAGPTRTAGPAGTAGPTGTAGPSGTAGPAETARAKGPAGATPPGAAAGSAGAEPTAAPPTASLPEPTPVAAQVPPATPAGQVPPATPAAAVPATAPAAPTAAATPAGPTPPTAPTAPVPATAPPAEAGAQTGTTVPFLDRILGGPTNPNAPEADDG